MKIENSVITQNYPELRDVQVGHVVPLCADPGAICPSSCYLVVQVGPAGFPVPNGEVLDVGGATAWSTAVIRREQHKISAATRDVAPIRSVVLVVVKAHAASVALDALDASPSSVYSQY